MAYQGQTAVIVGGTGGIGYATARQLLNEGLTVSSWSIPTDWDNNLYTNPIRTKNLALVDIVDNDNKSKELQKDYPAQNVSFWTADVSKRQSVDAAFKEVVQKFQRIDLLINSAGILKEKDPEAVMNINAVGLYG